METTYISEQTKVFISYKTGKDNTARASSLARLLETNGYTVFIDKDGLAAGHSWPETIFKNVLSSDVLIVLLTPEVIDSVWVRREVDLAKGAYIAVLPVLVEIEEKANEVLRALGMDNQQYVNYLQASTEQFNKLKIAIENNAAITHFNQQQWVTFLEERRRVRANLDPRNQPAQVDGEYAVYRYTRKGIAHPTEIALATGDIVRIGGMDVIVNSENVYMQMARFFETKTVSANIRRSGVYSRGFSYTGDNIQDELDIQIKTRYEGKVPIEVSEVVVTTAGSSRGNLSGKNKARYIFHVATVQRNETGSGLQHLTDSEKIEECVWYCLQEVQTVSSNNGNIFLGENGVLFADADRTRTLSQAEFTPVKTIIFPLIGTGTGGAKVSESVAAMVQGIIRFLEVHQELSLERIVINAFLNKHVAEVESYLDSLDNLVRIK